jgi:hypothetical protein
MTTENKKDLPLLLVIANDFENWYTLCEGCSDEFTVEQAMWEDISLTSYPDKALIRLRPSHHPNNVRQNYTRMITPFLVLIRAFYQYIGKLGMTPDYRNIVYGFMHAGIPMINSFSAVITEVERPLMMSRLRAIERRVGSDIFPVIPQTFYSESCEMYICPSMPFVVKVGFPHAGYGKIRCRQDGDWDDLRSVVALHHDYIYAEPFIDSDCEIRITCIAPDYIRMHKRTSQG